MVVGGTPAAEEQGQRKPVGRLEVLESGLGSRCDSDRKSKFVHYFEVCLGKVEGQLMRRGARGCRGAKIFLKKA